MRRTTAGLLRWFDVRSTEVRPLVQSFIYIALVVASFLLAKPIRNGLFLERYGAYRLVYVYVGVPLVLLVFVPLYARLTARRGQQRVIVATLGFFALNVIGFWYGFRFLRIDVLPAVFYVWVNCYGIIAPVQAWTYVHGQFDTRQARRLFGLVGAGATAGALAGGLLARTLVGPVGGTVNLLLVQAALIAAAAAVVSLPATGQAQALTSSVGRSRTPFRQTLRQVAGTRYLRLVAMLVALVAVATQWTQFQFSLAAVDRFGGDADQLTAFFGEFNFYLGLLALVVQVFLTGPMLRRFGLGVTILVLPVALLGASSVVVLFPVMGAVLLASGLDQSLRFSLHTASFELLYLPLDTGVRGSLKATIDMIVSRFADGVGGVVLGLATQGFSLYVVTLPGAGFGLRGVAALTVAVVSGWAMVAFALRRGYVDAIREGVRRHRIDAERASAAWFDRSLAEMLTTQLDHEDPDEILYALSLIETQHRYAASVLDEALRALLGHADAEIRRRALSLLRTAGDGAAVEQVEPLLQDPVVEVRTEALLYLTAQTAIDPIERLHELGDFSDVSVRGGIVAFLARPGPTQNLDAAGLMLEAMAGDAGPDGVASRVEAARLLQTLPDDFDPQLRQLLGDEDEHVTRQALRAVARRSASAMLPDVLPLLGSVGLAAEAVRTLASFGDAIVDDLRAVLLDPAVSLQVRRKVPMVLLAIGTRRSQQALMESLLQADTSLRFRIITALNKLQRDSPDVVLDRRTIELILAAEILGHYRSYQIMGTLDEALGRGSTIGATINLSLGEEVERIFRLLGLLYPDQDFHSAHFGLQSDNPQLRANALEWLDNILGPRLRDLLLPLIDSQTSTTRRIQKANELMGASVDTKEQAVEALLVSDVPWLRAAAVHAIGALGLRDLEGRLDECLADAEPDVRETARLAKERVARRRAADDSTTDDSLTGRVELAESMGVG